MLESIHTASVVTSYVDLSALSVDLHGFTVGMLIIYLPARYRISFQSYPGVSLKSFV